MRQARLPAAASPGLPVSWSQGIAGTVGAAFDQERAPAGWHRTGKAANPLSLLRSRLVQKS